MPRFGYHGNIGVQTQRAGTAQKISIPAAVGGLNTKDIQSQMESTDAVLMENWFPSQGSVITRKGYKEYATGLTGNIETLAEYYSGSTRKFLCANNGEINDITNPQSIQQLKNGFNSSRWQYVNFNGYLLLFNGQDTPQIYDGTSLNNTTITGENLTISNLDGVNIHKNRIYVWNTSAPDFWYGDTNAIAGTFTKFPLSRIMPQGGNLTAMATWNHDGGDGVDDYALFIMSSGDVAIYQGSDPGDLNNWSLVGIYKIGAPLSIRGITKMGGDVIIMTEQDFFFFSQVFQNSGVQTTQSKLSGGIIDAISKYKNNYGWEVKIYPKASSGGWLLFNIPQSTNNTYYQFAINTVTGSATKFTNMNARTWGVFNNQLYFGESGKVMIADTGLSDNGSPITCDIQTAYSNLGTSFEKELNAFRNIIATDGNVAINVAIGYDYGRSISIQGITSQSSGTTWGSLWKSPWTPVIRTRKDLIIADGSGTDISIRIKVNLNGQQMSWFRTDYSFNINNIL